MSARRRGVVPGRILAVAVLATSALLLPGTGEAQDMAVVGGEVRPVSGPVIPDGVVTVRDGRVAAVGSRADVSVPDGVRVVDATGLVVTPGIVDARTSLAHGPDAWDRDDPLIRSPKTRMADHLEALEVPGVFGMEGRDTGPHPWAMEGVTAVYVAPEAWSLVAGFGAVVKIAGGRLGPVVDSAAALHVTLGYDLPRRFDGAPTTRQGMAALLRQWLRRAGGAGTGETYRLGRPATEVEGLPDGSWERTPDLSAVLAGERPVRFHAYAPDDLLTALRVAREFDLRAVVEGAYGAHLVVDRLVALGVPVVLGPAISGSGRTQRAPDAFARTPEAAALLHGAGVPVALSTDGARGRAVTVEAAMARGHGLPPDAALRAVTLEAARILGVDDRLGSLEPGKDADLVLWDGDPMGTWGEACLVIVDGEMVFERSER